MHASSLAEMQKFIQYIGAEVGTDRHYNILDVGSQDVNGSYQGVIDLPRFSYLGYDICEGANVNIVGKPYAFPFASGTFDLVISGQAMEHVPAPWCWLPELARVTVVMGYVCVIVPHTFKYHTEGGAPDCWRVFPDGMRGLVESTCPMLTIVELHKNNTDTVLWARKED